MKRFVLSVTGLALVLAGCGADHSRSAPPVTSAPARALNVHQIAAARRAKAWREGATFISQFVPPGGAQWISEPPRALSDRAVPDVWRVAGPYRLWRVAKPLRWVAAWVRNHPPAGWHIRGENSGSSPPLEGFYFVPRNGWPSRYLSVEMLGLTRERQTVVRVDAQAVWFYPRSSTEKVPAPVHEIDVSDQNLGPTGANRERPVVSVSRRVTDPAEVATIVRWFNALPVDQGIGTMCGLPSELSMDVVFRSPNGTPLASAGAPALYPAGACEETGFSIHGKSQASLGPYGPSFVSRVGKLLGVR